MYVHSPDIPNYVCLQNPVRNAIILTGACGKPNSFVVNISCRLNISCACKVHHIHAVTWFLFNRAFVLQLFALTVL